MRFEKEVYDQYLTYASLGNRVAAKLSLYNKLYDLPELRDLIDTSKVKDGESLGVLEIPVENIIGIASICGKASYTADFLPVEKPDSKYAKEWCNIYLQYLNDKELSPISCYEYLGKFYVIDGKKRVSVMKCNGARLITADVTRIPPIMKDSHEVHRYYSFLECYQKTGLYQVALCPKLSFTDLQKALGHDKDYQWTQQDRRNMLFQLYTVETALKMSNLDRLPIGPIDALMILLEDYTPKAVARMSTNKMAKVFKENKDRLFALCSDTKMNENHVA